MFLPSVVSEASDLHSHVSFLVFTAHVRNGMYIFCIHTDPVQPLTKGKFGDQILHQSVISLVECINAARLLTFVALFRNGS